MFALHFFLVAGYAILAAAVQVARVVPSPVGDTSNRFRHDSYIDSKVRQVAVNILNHQDYHQRNVIFPSSASMFPSFMANLTNATSLLLETGIQLQPSPTISSSTPLQSVGSTNVTGLSFVGILPSSIQHQTQYKGAGNLSITVSLLGRKFSTIPPLTGILPTGSAIRGASIRSTFAASSSFNTTVTNTSSIRRTGSVFATSAYGSGVTLNMTRSGSTGCIYTVTRYNLSTATVTATIIPAPVGSSGPFRQAIADSLHLTSDLTRAANAGIPWEQATDDACFSHLSSLNGKATNPSGISPCYNIRSLNDSTGAFNAELRLYRVASVSGDWTQLQSEGVKVGVAYPDATVSLQGMVKKRSCVEVHEPTGRTIVSRLFARASDITPRLLQTLSFQGQVHDNSVSELSIQSNALALLTPKINLAGKIRSGASISTQLSLQDASFVNGLFANFTSNATKVSSAMILGSREWLSKANSFSDFPLSLLLVVVWSALLLATDGYDFLQKLKCRREDRKRVLTASSGGGGDCGETDNEGCSWVWWWVGGRDTELFS